MNNDFTLDHYQRMLKGLREQHVFIPYTQYFKEYGKYILLRHDVDISPERALSLAVIENRLGLHATYFIDPHSLWYNSFDKRVKNVVKRIMELGHYLGLHFNFEYWGFPSTGLPIEEYVEKEKHITEQMYGVNLYAISFHNPNQVILDMYQEKYYAGLVNCNGAELRKLYIYKSDSNYKLPELAYADKLQLLLHPVWWTAKKLRQEDKIKTYLTNTMTKKYKSYLQRRKSG